MKFLLTWLATAVACAAAIWIIPGLSITGGIAGIIVFGLVLALVNIAIKPILQILSLPITMLTLGIFYLVVNTVMLYLAAVLANGMFDAGIGIAGFGSAFLGSIIISIVSAIMNGIVGSEA
jgi:putative membrane protein